MNIERWIIPILAVMIIVVGGIRALPWLKSKLPSVYGSAVIAHEETAPEINRKRSPNSAPKLASITIDTALAPLITEQNVPLNEVRSQKLTNSLSGAISKPSIHISTDSDDLILTEDVSAPKLNQQISRDISALELITESRETFAATAKAEPPSQVPEQIQAQEQAPKLQKKQVEIVSTDVQDPKDTRTPEPLKATNKTQQLQNTNETLITSLVSNWAAAWSARSPGQYFQYYSPDMSTARYPSYGKWRAWRKSRLDKPKQIDVQIEELKISLDQTTPTLARTSFIQHYRADTYADVVLKELKLIQRNGRWLIYTEQTLETL